MLTVDDLVNLLSVGEENFIFSEAISYLKTKIFLGKLFGKYNSIGQCKGIFFLKKYPEITF